MDAHEIFNQFRFAGLNAHSTAQGLTTMGRTAGDRIVVRVAPSEIFKTRLGYGLHLDGESVQWLKKWQVSNSTAGIEVLLFSNSFLPRVYCGNGFVSRFEAGKDAEKRLEYDWWYDRAVEQKEEVLWVT